MYRAAFSRGVQITLIAAQAAHTRALLLGAPQSPGGKCIFPARFLVVEYPWERQAQRSFHFIESVWYLYVSCGV